MNNIFNLRNRRSQGGPSIINKGGTTLKYLLVKFKCQGQSSKSFKFLREINLHVRVKRIELEPDFSSTNLKTKRNIRNIIISTKFHEGKAYILRQESYNSFVRSIKRIFFKHLSIQMYTTHSTIQKNLFKVMAQLSKKQSKI